MRRSASTCAVSADRFPSRSRDRCAGYERRGRQCGGGGRTRSVTYCYVRTGHLHCFDSRMDSANTRCGTLERLGSFDDCGPRILARLLRALANPFGYLTPEPLACLSCRPSETAWWQFAFRSSFLAHQAWLMGDAIARTLFRLLVTHRRMLEWITAAQANLTERLDLLGFYRHLAGGVILALVAAVMLLAWIIERRSWPCHSSFYGFCLPPSLFGQVFHRPWKALIKYRRRRLDPEDGGAADLAFL